MITTEKTTIAKAFDPKTSQITTMDELDKVLTYLGAINKENVTKHATPEKDYLAKEMPAPVEPVSLSIVVPLYLDENTVELRRYQGASSL